MAMVGCWLCTFATSVHGADKAPERSERCRSSATKRSLRWSMHLSFLACIARGAHAKTMTDCKLTAVALRHRDEPIDLLPPFSPTTYTYAATLDFAMESFSVDVRPADGCEVDDAPNAEIEVTRGASTQLSIFARDPHTEDRQQYQIKVRRLEGAETEVNSLRIPGAELKPAFSPEIRDYKAFLELKHDMATLSYVVQDNGQLILCTAEEQHLPGDQAAGRRLQGAGSSSTQTVGEVQYREHHQAFPIDVSHIRRVTLTIESADPMQARKSRYTITILRAGCPEQRPYYDQKAQACVVNCPSAFYPNPESGRCSECNSNCAVCLSILHCQLCKQDTVDVKYVLQADGSCLEVPEPILTHYWWWCVGFGVCLVLLACMGFVLLCQCLCDACCGRRPAYDYSDGSDDSLEAEFGYGKRGW
mmetsp:Transcript_59923/g.104823  ORF Transcript_59923/g.104823 Transcript_59923/m.104823 type:complete len:418 (+) Transcript_59923:65-1318(+)